ncbi:MAG TPA: heavy-metal-associated domain-containing protein [Gaiellaceae bacterium]|nr:heavy-metal-associated domain-containing protein [Gaiellaceae bacterium]
MSEPVTYTVPKIHCGHCAASIKEEVSEVAGVEAVGVDVDTKVVTILGQDLSDADLRAAIREAGYEAA